MFGARPRQRTEFDAIFSSCVPVPYAKRYFVPSSNGSYCSREELYIPTAVKMNEGNERDLGRLQERTNQDDNAERREKKKRKKTRHHHGHRHHHDKSRKHHHGDEHHTHASGRPRQALNTTAETVDYDSESEMERGERAGGSFAQHVPWTSANEEMQPRAPIKTPCLGIANESKFNDYDEQVEEGYDCFGDAVAHLSDRLDETPTQQEQELRPSTLAVDLSGETQVYPGVLSPSPSSRVDSLPGNSNPLNPTSSRLLSARPVDPDEDRRMLREELRNVLAEQQAAAIAPVVQAIPADNVPVANLPRDEAHSPQDYVHDDDSSVSSASSRGKGCTLKQWMIYGGIAAALALAGLAVGLVFAFQEDKQKDPLSPTLAPSPSTTITTSRPTIQPTISSFPQPTGQETPEPSFSPVTLPTTSFPVTKSPTVSPTRLPTPAPTTLPPSPTPTTLPPSPSPTMPTQAPIAIPQDLVDLISIHSFDAGAASRIPGTPQNKALNWLARNENIDSYSDDRKIQRYALATVYYSTGGGETWDPFGLWLTDERECGSWGNAISCEVGSVVSFEQNGFMEGTIPNEIALLSNLGEDSQDIQWMLCLNQNVKRANLTVCCTYCRHHFLCSKLESCRQQIIDRYHSANHWRPDKLDSIRLFSLWIGGTNPIVHREIDQPW